MLYDLKLTNPVGVSIYTLRNDHTYIKQKESWFRKNYILEHNTLGKAEHCPTRTKCNVRGAYAVQAQRYRPFLYVIVLRIIWGMYNVGKVFVSLRTCS